MISAINMLICATLWERIRDANIWYALPAIIAISLVYSATRHEAIFPILHHALRTALWIAGFMAAFFLILWLIS
jgi:hypothetical protein